MVAFVKTLAVALSAVGAALATREGLRGGYANEADVVEARGAPNFVLDADHAINIARRTLSGRSNTNYVQDYKTGGNVQFSSGTNEFTLTYSVTQDFVVGVGWQPGGTAPITHSGNWTVTSGLGSLGVYGWSTNPLVEYYIMDCNHGVSTGGTQKGTVTSDGATYAIWEHQQVNQPSIQGTSTFNQFISIRDSCTTSGTITVENHFNAWKSLGMDLGTLNYQVVAVESWSGSGSASQKISNAVAAPAAEAAAAAAAAAAVVARAQTTTTRGVPSRATVASTSSPSAGAVYTCLCPE